MEERVKDNLMQVRVEALHAIYLHQKQIISLRRKNLLVEFLSIAVPVFYIVPRFLLKDTEYFKLVEVIWELLGAILLVVVIFKIVFKWQEREVKHSFMAYRNRDIANEALKFSNNETLNKDVIEQFLKRVQENDANDNEDLLLNATREENQEAYRDALKKLIPGSTRLCPKCEGDPWIFKAGDCNLCGNTPKIK